MKTLQQLKTLVLEFEQHCSDSDLFNLLYDWVIGEEKTDLVEFLHERIENNNAGAEWWTQGDLEKLDYFFYLGVDCELDNRPKDDY